MDRRTIELDQLPSQDLAAAQPLALSFTEGARMSEDQPGGPLSGGGCQTYEPTGIKTDIHWDPD